jgi:predicted nucleotidyltransferase
MTVDVANRQLFLYAGRTLDEWVPVVVERIAASHEPEQIILFGSLARGEVDRDSDIDLLVVFRRVHDKRKRAVELRRAVADVPAPIDFVVTDLDEIERRGSIVGPVLGTATTEGRVLYERGR